MNGRAVTVRLAGVSPLADGRERMGRTTSSYVTRDTGMSHSKVWFVAVALAVVMGVMTQMDQVRQDHARLLLTCYVGGFVVLNVALWIVGKAAGALREVQSAKVYAFWGWTVLAAAGVALVLFQSVA